MTRLKICSLFVFAIFLISFSIAGDFGEIDPKDENGEEIKPTINEWGGSTYNVKSGNQLTVDYNGQVEDYTNLEGDLTFSEAGKLVSGNFEVTGDGTYTIGNLKVPLQSGSKVTFEDGDIKIEDPGEMISKDDVDFIESESAWDENTITLSGDGVDFMELREVSLDENGYFLQDPENVQFDDFTVNGEGNVYFITDSDGDRNLDINGAYVSVSESGQFSIGSNVYGEWVSVKPNSENKYGLRHDIGTDYISFKSVGGVTSSYLTVGNRESEGLVPHVSAVGLFAVDNDGSAVYRGEQGKIYTVMSGNVNNEFGATGTTASPIEMHFYDLEGTEIKKLGDYGGAVGIGNDNAIGYGFNSNFILGGEYGTNSKRTHGRYEGYNLNYGISNTLAYNYDLSVETIEKWFQVRIDDRVGFLNDPRNVRLVFDNLARLPKAALRLQTLKFLGGGGRTEGNAWYEGNANGINLFGRSGHSPGVLTHELTHIFDYFSGRAFDNEWRAIGGSGGPHSRWYGAESTAESKATVGEVIFAPKQWWDAYNNGQTGYHVTDQNRMKLYAKVALFGKYGYIQQYDATRILSYGGYSVDPKNPINSYNQVIQQATGR